MESAKETSATSTGSWVLKWLGILWAAGTVISLAKRGFAIELRGLPQVIHDQYAWLRDMLFEPVVLFFPKFPPELKDGIMLYALISATAYRMCIRYYREYHGRDSSLYERVFFALFWPLLLFSGNTLLGLLFFEAVIVGSVALAFFIWNHLEGAYGPG